MGKKKEKITYVDDGRTIADMSGVRGGFMPRRESWKPSAPLREHLATFFGAMKMMLLPMLAVVAGMIVIFLIVTVLFRLSY